MRLRIVLSLMLVMIAAAAGAQQFDRSEQSRDRERRLEAARALEAEIRQANFHRGQFYLLSRLQLADIGIEQQFFTPTTNSGSVSLGLSAPQKLFYVPTKKFILSAEVTPSYAYVARGRDAQWGLRARADAHFLLNHLYLDFYGSDANELVADTGEIGQLLTARRPAFGLASELRYSSKTFANFAVERSSIRFPIDRYQPEGVDIEQLERDEWNSRVTMNHRTLPRTTFSIIGELRDSQFVNVRDRDARRTYTAAGATWEAPRTIVHLEAGPGRLEIKQPGRRDFRGALGAGHISQQVGRRWNLDGAVQRDVIFSLAENNDYYISDRASARAKVNVTRKFSIDFGSTLGRDRYDVPVAGVRRVDDTEFDSVGWLYQMKHLDGGFEVGYFRRTSNVTVESDDGIRVFLRLSIQP